MALYDPEYIKSLPKLKPGLPAVVYVAKGTSPSRAYFKGLLEGWYENIPEHCKPNVNYNLRSLDDKEFKSQLFELAVFASLKKEGEAEYNPVLPNNKTPDILLSRAGGSAIIDVVTLFDEKVIQVEEAAVQDLLNYLRQIEHQYHLWMEYEELDPHTIKPNRIKREIIDYLDRINKGDSYIQELEIDADGLKAVVTAVERKDPDKLKPIAFGLTEPIREVKPLKSISGRIREKIRKYKSEDKPLIVALFRGGNIGVDWDDVASVLYGKLVRAINTSTKEFELIIEDRGILMPYGTPPALYNTSLTGVLYCRISFETDKVKFPMVYLKNPFAKYEFELGFPCYPQVTSD